MNVLMTSGGCDEHIDGVRFLSNFSSGRTAAEICRYFAERGHQLTFVRNSRSAAIHSSDKKITEFTFSSFKDLQNLLEELAAGKNNFDAVISAAAVSDFGVDYVLMGERKIIPGSVPKISSDSRQDVEMSIVLKKHPKIISRMKQWFGNSMLVGFKLTNKSSGKERTAAVKKLFSTSDADFVVSNDLTEIDDNTHKFVIYRHKKGIPDKAADGNTKAEMAVHLEKLLINMYDRSRS